MTPNRIAVCDQYAFYPFRALVEGPLQSIRDVIEAERFVRCVLLHDEIVMEGEPLSAFDEDPEWTEEEIASGARNVVVAFLPDIRGYDGVVSRPLGPKKLPQTSLSPRLTKLAADLSNADSGNPYFQAHIDYIGRLVGTLREGGSLLCAGEIASKIVEISSVYPEELFSRLDYHWQEYARSAHAGDIGFVLPPVISIVLSRARDRESIISILLDLKDEWASAREKVWRLIDELKNAKTLEHANDVKRRLKDASNYFLPDSDAEAFQPIRILWNLVAEAGKGAISAKISGGDPGIGALVGGTAGAINLIKERMPNFGKTLFGLGAFDLAKRIRHEIGHVEPTMHLLDRMLSKAEKNALGID